MYHQIKEISDDELTVSINELEKQFAYIAKKYTTQFFSEINTQSKNNIIITFDDGYYNNYQYLPALLEKYNLKATLFICTKFIQEGYGGHDIMSFEDLKKLDHRYFETGLHTHQHPNLRALSLEEINNDIVLNQALLQKNNIPFSNILAYPYGKYPKSNPQKQAFFDVLKECGIHYAVRIGNGINFFPTAHPYELKRIDIKGQDSIAVFKLKLIFGKLKLF